MEERLLSPTSVILLTQLKNVEFTSTHKIRLNHGLVSVLEVLSSLIANAPWKIPLNRTQVQVIVVVFLDLSPIKNMYNKKRLF